MDGCIEGAINQGPRAHQSRYYRTALFNTLIHLRPRVCLEIGTYIGNSTNIFKKYFSDYKPHGKLITCDIRKYVNDIDSANTKFVRVYPHTLNVGDWHNVTDGDMLPNWQSVTHAGLSVSKNIDIIEDVLEEIGETNFDFIFIDGDHQHEAVAKDFQVATALAKSDSYYFMDDIDEYQHECAEYYHTNIKNRFDTYEFEDWDLYPGAALMQSKKEIEE